MLHALYGFVKTLRSNVRGSSIQAVVCLSNHLRTMLYEPKS